MRCLPSWLLPLLLCALAHAQEPALPCGEPLLPESALPDHERRLNHARLIRGWNQASLERGREIYQRVCHSCHGDLSFPGSMPNALRFAEGTFSQGADPLALYRTLTRGWRLMPPQVQLVPREKCDVIHPRTVLIAPENFGPAQCFRLTYALHDAAQREFSGSMDGTLHALAKP